jgi:galactonate dehydratase
VTVKITSIQTYPVPPRWLFVRVDTDEGLTGWGEPVVEGRARTVAAAVAELSEYLIGQDPGRIEDHWQVLTKGGFYRGGPVLSSAVAGLDQALWDIAGKRFGVPVYQLLGGPVRDRVRVYSWIGGDDPADVATAAQAQVAAGFTAVKMNAGGAFAAIDTPSAVAEVVDRVAAVREAIGTERDLAIDFHGRISPATARRLLPRLEPYAPMFVEEPVVPELGPARLAELVACSPVPIATGERLYSRWDFRPVLEAGIAVAQPDLSHAGGISEVRRIAALAETFGTSLAPHCPLGPLALAASLQVDLATPNVLIQEQSLGIHYNVHNDLLDYLLDRSVFTFRDGYVERPLGPGLGVEIDEKAVAEAARLAASGPDWHNPVWRLPDGSFTEW